MCLINTATKIPEEITGDPPEYAILSHRWREEEALFHSDFAGVDMPKLKGWQKFFRCCEIARGFGFRYLWMDTCCIDKNSSVELSEAINSMFGWYRPAALCIAYLDDVSNDRLAATVSSSEWFKRGWTLQELIAPASVIFYSKDWEVIGTKTSLASTIVAITRIDRKVLLGGAMDDVNIAKKMSWASGRQTTRVEDEAYSLMGIFGVHMPAIYGEGRKAFIRLQAAILKVSYDQSIFAWCDVSSKILDPFEANRYTGYESYGTNGIRAGIFVLDSHGTTNSSTDLETWRNSRTHVSYPSQSSLDYAVGLLAICPHHFSDSYDIVQKPHTSFERALGISNLGQDFSMTNNGIRIRMPLEPIDAASNLYIAYLACENADRKSVVALFLQQRDRQYVRVLPCNLMKVPYSDIPLASPTISSNNALYIKAFGADGSLGQSNLRSSRHFLISTESIMSCRSYGFTVIDHGPLLSWRRHTTSGSLTLLISPALYEELGYILFVDDVRQEGFLLILAELLYGQPTLELCVSRADKKQSEPPQYEDMMRDEVLFNACGHASYTYGQSADEIYRRRHGTGGRRMLSSGLRCVVADLPGGRRILVSISESMDMERAKSLPWEVSIRILSA